MKVGDSFDFEVGMDLIVARAQCTATGKKLGKVFRAKRVGGLIVCWRIE